ncbi:hypothetical protein [Undibacterium parvum]|uniref:Uncharacterized protein n=1 Tax=Undibacterium parvum TaxID=401471 RepID=A0A3Q9BRU8_9BURK|nr:hypothetical protein [Undibacterium parvum]AZP12577.1 hypothetical protein EJN92_11520 [Undibacterium parvum]
MNDKVLALLKRMAELEEELRVAALEQEAKALFQIKGKRIEFEESIRQTHLQLKQGFFHWLVNNRPQNLITGPIIYSMIFPLLILDLFVSFYQLSCFPIYKVSKVKRADYIIYDRQQLEYLNFIEKFHCTYCAYANGLMAYVSEIVARTEEYFCPIKHARKAHASHRRYGHFLDYGQAEDYEAKLEEFRKALSAENQNK